MIRAAGLGSIEDFPTDLNGMRLDCRDWKVWAIAPDCWKLSPAGWQQALEFARPFTAASFAPPPAVPLAYSTLPAYSDPSQFDAEVDAAITAGADATRENIADYARANATEVPEPADDSTGHWLLWGLIGAAGLFAYVALSGAGGPRRWKGAL